LVLLFLLCSASVSDPPCAPGAFCVRGSASTLGYPLFLVRLLLLRLLEGMVLLLYLVLHMFLQLLVLLVLLFSVFFLMLLKLVKVLALLFSCF
jgi:hypothetical protein